jgi:hypothetical protein
MTMYGKETNKEFLVAWCQKKKNYPIIEKKIY